MAATAEAIQTNEYQQTREVYAHSLSTIRRLGYLALNGQPESQEVQLAAELAFADFSTAVTEMLKTDEKFRSYVDIDNKRSHDVTDGKICAADGQPMVEILKTGARSSKEAARINPVLTAQSIRDECDVEIAERADALEPGMTIWGISMEPKEELKRFEGAYTALGYKKGLVYIQTYSKVDNNTLVAASYSVDLSNEERWRKILASHNVHIPDGESTNTWLKFGAEQKLDAHEAEEFARGLRKEYYESIGETKERNSVSSYVAVNTEFVRQLFDVYYLPLAEAVHTGQNNDTLRSFAKSLLNKNIEDLKPEIRQQLIRIGNSSKFDDEAGRILDSVIRYAVVEELRKGLSQRPESKPHALFRESHASQALTEQQVHNLLASNVQVGIEAQRSYGGCPGNIDLRKGIGSTSLFKDLLNLSENFLNPQDMFGGKDCVEVKDGQKVRCPECKQDVTAKVPEKGGKIYCTNPDCKLAHPSVR